MQGFWTNVIDQKECNEVDLKMFVWVSIVLHKRGLVESLFQHFINNNTDANSPHFITVNDNSGKQKRVLILHGKVFGDYERRYSE